MAELTPHDGDTPPSDEDPTMSAQTVERPAAPPPPSEDRPARRPPPEPAAPKRLDVAAVIRHLAETGSAPELAAAFRRVEADPAAADDLIAAAAVEARAEAEATLRRARYTAYTAGRPVDFEESSYDRLLPQQDPEGRTRGWWASGHRTLLLVGLPAKGKSDAGFAICNEVARADLDGRTGPVNVRAIRTVDLVAALMPPAPHEARDEVLSARRAQLVRDATRCDLLLLDDVTAQKASDFVRTELYKVLDARVNDPRKRTIVTANAPAREASPDGKVPGPGAVLEQAVGGHVVSRLRKGCLPVWVDGEDLRRFATWDPFSDPPAHRTE